MTVRANFIPPMLCERLVDPGRLNDHRFVTEQKLDGQRAQLHVCGGRAVACYSRRGLDLLCHPGMAWLRDIAWPFADGVLDGEACAGDGHEGIQAVFTERQHPDGAMALIAFDLLQLDGRSVMREPWRDRRKRLEDLFANAELPRVGVVPVTRDAARLHETWIGMGGEGIVLKDRMSLYRPGGRSAAWLKLEPKLGLEVIVTGGSAKRIAGQLGRGGHAGDHVHTSALPAACRLRARSRRAVRAHDHASGRAMLGRDDKRAAAAPAVPAVAAMREPHGGGCHAAF